MEKRYYDINGFHVEQDENNSRFEMTLQEEQDFFTYCNTVWAGKDFRIVPDKDGKPSVIPYVEPVEIKNARKIKMLKLQLSETDYKVIKNYELIAAGLEPEYDTAILHNERQLVRDEINRLEQEIISAINS